MTQRLGVAAAATRDETEAEMIVGRSWCGGKKAVSEFSRVACPPPHFYFDYMELLITILDIKVLISAALTGNIAELRPCGDGSPL